MNFELEHDITYPHFNNEITEKVHISNNVNEPIYLTQYDNFLSTEIKKEIFMDKDKDEDKDEDFLLELKSYKNNLTNNKNNFINNKNKNVCGQQDNFDSDFIKNFVIDDSNFEQVKNLICCRRYDLLERNKDLFVNISAAQLANAQILRTDTLLDTLLKEAPTSLTICFFNTCAKRNFIGEDGDSIYKIFKFMLFNYECSHDTALAQYELIKMFYEFNIESSLFNLINEYITIHNIYKYLYLIKYIVFTFIESYPQTISLFNNKNYENNLMIKLLFVLDCDNDTNKQIKEIIDCVLQYNLMNLNVGIDVNLMDKAGNTILSNCLQQYSIKKIMYLLEIGCNPSIKNPITGTNVVNDIQSTIYKLKDNNHNDTNYYYYKIIKNYFAMHDHKIQKKNTNNLNIQHQNTNNLPQSNQKYFNFSTFLNKTALG